MSENPEKCDEKRKNRKRKKNFLMNARKYAKKGTFGRGSHLTEDTYQYFVRILETYKEGFETEEEKLIFANNVFEQTQNEEVNYSCNQIGCRVIETLLPFASEQVLGRFTESLGADLRPLCSDRFASHVLEALFRVCYERAAESETSRGFVLKLSKFLLNNLEDYVEDTYANQVMRTVLACFARVPRDDKGSLDAAPTPVADLVPEHADIVTDYGERLLRWPHFESLAFSELSSGLLQVLVRALHRVNLKLLRSMLRTLLKQSFSRCSRVDEASPHAAAALPDVFQSKPALMLLEAVLPLAGDKFYHKLHARCFAGRLATLSKLKDTNFTVQKLLNNCRDKAEFEAMYEELAEHLEDVLALGFSGVVLALVQACKRLCTKQGNVVQQLARSLHCQEPAERQDSLVAALVRLVPYERLEPLRAQRQLQVSLHGSMVLQALLQFNKPIRLVNSVLATPPEELCQLLCDMRGSHVADAFLRSAHVGEKSREKLVRRLQGSYQALAASKHGSRALDALWGAAGPKLRCAIMDELSHKDAAWSSGQFGRIIAAKLNVPLYKRSKQAWARSAGRDDRAAHLFAGIVPPAGP